MAMIDLKHPDECTPEEVVRYVLRHAGKLTEMERRCCARLILAGQANAARMVVDNMFRQIGAAPPPVIERERAGFLTTGPF